MGSARRRTEELDGVDGGCGIAIVVAEGRRHREEKGDGKKKKGRGGRLWWCFWEVTNSSG